MNVVYVDSRCTSARHRARATGSAPADIVDLTTFRRDRLASDCRYAALGALDATVGNLALSDHVTFKASGPDGFEVALHMSQGRVTGWFGGLQCEFASLEEAAMWAGRARTDAYRLRVDYVDDTAVKWTLEQMLPGGGAREMLASGHLVLMAALRRQRTEYRCNRMRQSTAR